MDIQVSPLSWTTRILWYPLLATFLIGGMISCSEQKPIKIGFVGGLSGRVADLGIGGRDGALLAVEHWNQNGGVNGRAVQLLVRDDQQDAETARKIVNQLLGEGVVAIIGHMTSSMSVTTVPLINATQIPMISPTTTTTALEGLDDYFFRVISSTTSYADKNARYQYETLGHRRIAAVLDTSNRAYTESWINGFEKSFESLGGEPVIKTEFRSSPEVDLAAVAREVLSSQPDGILILANSLDAALLCQQVRKLDSEVGLSTSEWAATERLVELGGRAVEGILISQFFDRDDLSSRYQEFKRAYIERYTREPGFAGVAAYDAVHATLSALARQSNGGLKQAILSQATFEGVQGAIKMDQFGDSVRKTYLTTVYNGKFEAIE